MSLPESPSAKTPGFNTRAVHAGQEFEPRTGAVVPPVHFSSTYAQEAIGVLRAGYEYGRGTNPTRDSLQDQLAALEGGTAAFSFSSGLAAEDSMIRALTRPGDHIVLGNDAYGGTYRLISRVLGEWGIGNTPVDMSNLDAVAAAVAASKTRLVWVETPSNPMMKITDIAALAKVAHDAGALLVVDNTFATPLNQQPLEFGATVSLQSATKFIGGHSDLLAGVATTKDDALWHALRKSRELTGATPGTLEAFLAVRGARTLALRLQRAQQTAMMLAERLEIHPLVTRVRYPGLPSHPTHATAKRVLKGFGTIISFDLLGEAEFADGVCRKVGLIRHATSLGAVESTMERRAAIPGQGHLPPSLLRLSVGIEDVDDLWIDLDSAIRSAAP
ncbi:aminotransferase class I/II-fold pyridoxal phosphate-dependent enzyme [uncultured Arthrobacter sp.]|uniref:trans-sulfuration enzyme family protein n=1 Tax=uncultured Arthrobacter sp. TaxID=114050 RepID=UPI003216F47E